MLCAKPFSSSAKGESKNEILNIFPTSYPSLSSPLFFQAHRKYFSSIHHPSQLPGIPSLFLSSCNAFFSLTSRSSSHIFLLLTVFLFIRFNRVESGSELFLLLYLLEQVLLVYMWVLSVCLDGFVQPYWEIKFQDQYLVVLIYFKIHY